MAAIPPTSAPPSAATLPTLIGRYALYGELSAGGMATVHVGKLLGQAGFTRTVAVKRLRPELARDPEFVTMFVDEARLVSKIRHPNVVPTLDVVVDDGEIFLVMEYVHGESLAYLMRRTAVQKGLVHPDLVVAILSGVLHGLHAAHEASHPRRGPLGIVHRDVSPQNILVGVDGTARLLDFGVAKAFHRLHTTQQGTLKGKVRYMAPEQLLGEPVTRLSDVYSAAVVLWEALTARPLFLGDHEKETQHLVLLEEVQPPTAVIQSGPSTLDPSAWRMLTRLDGVVLRALSRDPAQRYPTARDFAKALEAAVAPAPTSAVGAWVEQLAAPALLVRAQKLAEAGEDVPPSDPPPPMAPRTELPTMTAPPTGIGLTPSNGSPRTARSPRKTSDASFVWLAIATGSAGVLLLLVIAALLMWKRG